MAPHNPYVAPASSAVSIEPASLSALGELVKSWEKLRLLYNGILLLPGIGVLTVSVLRDSMPITLAITSGLLCGLAANASFFCGPLAELYLRAILFKGRHTPAVRWSLFGLGMLVSFGAMTLFLIGVLLEPLT